MLAIIRKGNGAYYTSLVFGYYPNPPKDGETPEQSQSSFYGKYYIVLNEKKDRLILQATFDRSNIYLVPLVLIVDPEQANWRIEENGNGCLGFLPVDRLFQLVESDSVPQELLARCIEEDSRAQYDEYQTVKDDADLEKLRWASWDFHDAYIKKFKKEEDALYILFDGVWGCQIELWFRGEVSYSMESREPGNDPYWSDATLICSRGYFVLTDCEDMTEEKMQKMTTEATEDDFYCWFKGRNLEYHIIPE